MICFTVFNSSCVTKGTAKIKIIREGNSLIVTTPEKVELVCTLRKKISGDYRVFGLNPNTLDIIPPAYFKNIITILSKDVAENILAMENCEANALTQAKNYPVACNDPETANRLEKCVEYADKHQLHFMRFQGEIFDVKSHTNNGKQIDWVTEKLQAVMIITNIETVTIRDSEKKTEIKL